MLRPGVSKTSSGDLNGAFLKLPITTTTAAAAAGSSHGSKGSMKSKHSRSKGKAAAGDFANVAAARILQLALAVAAGMLLQNFIFGLTAAEPKSAVVSSTLSKASFTSTANIQSDAFPDPFQRVLDRAYLHAHHCHSIDSSMAVSADAHVPVDKLSSSSSSSPSPLYNNHTAHLPPFGIISALEKYKAEVSGTTTASASSSDAFKSYPYQCQLPPEYECDETKFTVIFMAYNPDRLDKMYNQALKFVKDPEFAPYVQEVLIVWNGARDVEETNLGQALVDATKQYPIRISYPLKAGFPNDLMNRYHPRLQVQTKAIMYYDDDGPFYSSKATLAGFELWKRNANAQIGAMARKLDLGDRQREERQSILNGPGDRFFVSHCNRRRESAANLGEPFIGDELWYNYHEFANFGANMVLPSGSFLHSNYLCFLWHPAFEEIRKYVRAHPVNPDDGTVSTIVAQLSGRAPKVYSRRINVDKGGRRLMSVGDDADVYEEEYYDENYHEHDEQQQQPTLQRMDSAIIDGNHRNLMEGIDWDHAHPHQSDQKNKWGRLRSDAANSLTRYFGSINSGSIGWCYGTPYEKDEYCKPEMAKVGMLPWMNPDHTPKQSCP
mmetsp:Transcript_8565/g.24636  ORF Transcript_8565/g.24636 Transcript_8565/m.24636 type:complete len:607 (+) Transcript_8565:174-1994(+)